jgi:hypothetical protein
MIWRIESFNGFDLNTPTYFACFDNADRVVMQPSVRTTNVPRQGSAPTPGSHTRDVDYLVVSVTMQGDQQVAYEALVQNLRTVDPALYQLIASDQDGVQWYVLARPVLHTRRASVNKVTFEVFDSIWRSTAEQSDTWSITASGQTKSVVVGGNQETYPTFEITATSIPSGYYQYRQYIKNYNPIAKAQIDAIDITNGGWNTASLVSGGKMQADGDDLRVIVNGRQVPRWFGGGGINSATTKVYVRLGWKPGVSMKLRTAVSNSGIPVSLDFEINATNKALILAMPNRGIFLVDNEEFSYYGRAPGNCTLTVVDREIRGTVASSHAIGAVAYWVEQDIQIVYGNPTEVAPVYSDVYKPVFDLATSTNSSRVYSNFSDTAGLRVGRWAKYLAFRNGTLSRLYTGNQGASADVDPATDAGMEIASYPNQGRWQPETADMWWQFVHVAGIVSVAASGEKYKKGATTSWPNATLESSNGVKWVVERSEAAPASALTWTAWSFTALTVSTGALAVRFRFSGSVNAILGNLARYEVDSVTVVLTAANVVQVAMRGEEGNYMFTARWENTTTGEWMDISYPMSLNKPLVINTDELDVTYRGVGAARAVNDLSENRVNWLRLLPNTTNVLKYTAPATGNVTNVIKRRDRSL